MSPLAGAISRARPCGTPRSAVHAGSGQPGEWTPGFELHQCDLTLPTSTASRSRARADGSDLRQVVNLPRQQNNTNFNGANFAGKDLSGFELTDCTFEEADLTGCKLERADLSGGNFNRAKLARAALADSKLVNAWFMEATLEGANLERCDCRNSDFGGADLSGALSRYVVRGLTSPAPGLKRRRSKQQRSTA